VTTRSSCWSPGSGCAVSTSNDWSSPISTGRATGCRSCRPRPADGCSCRCPKEVGWAVIDYIRAGRPTCDCRQVFIRHTTPIGAFSDQDHLHQILLKHARAAHVPVSEKRRHGMHSLRHTLATRLMEGGTPVEQIADILGHQCVQSTGVYLKSSLGLLAGCALDPDSPATKASR